MSYQILIVDDEALAIRGIEAGVRWNELDISKVLTAQNIRQAKEILSSQAIDIMLCDIEMPQGNGLELLAWVRENQPAVETIILTCHADFDYARKALQLGSLDYMLKAMPYSDLEAIIHKAVSKIERDRQLLLNSQFGKIWQKNRPLSEQQFWMDIVTGNIKASGEAISQAAAERGITLRDNDLVLPLLLYYQSAQENSPADEIDKSVTTSIRSVMASGIMPEPNLYTLQREQDNLMLLLTGWSDAVFGSGILRNILMEIVTAEYKKHGCELYFYVGQPAKADQLPHTVYRLKAFARNDVSLKNNIQFLGESNEMAVPVKDFDLNVWSELITERSYGQFVDEATAYLQGMAASSAMDSRALRQFHQDFLQMIYSILKQNKVQAHLLLSDDMSNRLFERSTRTVKDMIIWVRHIVAKIQEDSLTDADSLSVVEKVKRYIAQHLNELPSREVLANLVYLNPDYLTRLFKKETGMTLIGYAQVLRIDYAKDLLAKTDFSISKIAAKIGYSNFSHFTRAFKEITGMSPTDYKLLSAAQTRSTAANDR